MVDFWDQPTCFDAKFRRVIVPGADSTSIEDGAALLQIWEDSIEESLSQILHGVQLAPDWSVLEIGAGVGRLLRPLSEKVAKAYGVDISPAMVEFASEYLRCCPDTRVFLNDGRSLSMFESETFDFCYSMICFQHIPDVGIVKDYLREIARVLKPDGLVRVQVRRELSVRRRITRAIRFCNPSHLRGTGSRRWCGDREIGFEGNRYTRKSLQRILRKAGLYTVDWQEGLGRTDWLWMTGVKRRHTSGSTTIPCQVERAKER